MVGCVRLLCLGCLLFIVLVWLGIGFVVIWGR